MNLIYIKGIVKAVLIIGLLTALFVLYVSSSISLAILGFGMIAVLGIVVLVLAFLYEIKNRP
jgi:hypothetical protein